MWWIKTSLCLYYEFLTVHLIPLDIRIVFVLELWYWFIVLFFIVFVLMPVFL